MSADAARGYGIESASAHARHAAAILRGAPPSAYTARAGVSEAALAPSRAALRS